MKNRVVLKPREEHTKSPLFQTSKPITVKTKKSAITTKGTATPTSSSSSYCASSSCCSSITATNNASSSSNSYVNPVMLQELIQLHNKAEQERKTKLNVGIAVSANTIMRKDNWELLHTFEQCGHKAQIVMWNSPEITNWSCFDVVVLRTCWVFHIPSKPEFLSWLASVSNKTLVVNSFEVFSWNVDHNCLNEVSLKGIPVVPSVLVDEPLADSDVIQKTIEKMGWKDGGLVCPASVPSSAPEECLPVLVPPPPPTVLSCDMSNKFITATSNEQIKLPLMSCFDNPFITTGAASAKVANTLITTSAEATTAAAAVYPVKNVNESGGGGGSGNWLCDYPEWKGDSCEEQQQQQLPLSLLSTQDSPTIADFEVISDVPKCIIQVTNQGENGVTEEESNEEEEEEDIYDNEYNEYEILDNEEKEEEEKRAEKEREDARIAQECRELYTGHWREDVRKLRSKVGKVSVRPFTRSVLRDGEISFIFIGGMFSHSVRRLPPRGDYRTSHTLPGLRVRQYFPSDSELFFAINAYNAATSSIRDACGKNVGPIFARVDIIVVDAAAGRMLVNDIELVDPVMYLAYCRQAASAIVDAVVSYVNKMRVRTAATVDDLSSEPIESQHSSISAIATLSGSSSPYFSGSATDASLSASFSWGYYCGGGSSNSGRNGCKPWGSPPPGDCSFSCCCSASASFSSSGFSSPRQVTCKTASKVVTSHQQQQQQQQRYKHQQDNMFVDKDKVFSMFFD